jgi:DNA-binding NarL/FixJ family response regulator
MSSSRTTQTFHTNGVAPRRRVQPDGALPCVTVALGHFGDVIRLGLDQILKQDPSIAIVARNTRTSSLECATRQRSLQVVIVGEHLAPPAALPALKAAAPMAGVIVLVHQASRARYAQMTAAGATCLSTDASSAEILAAVRQVAAGARGTPSLTPRETEVLACIQEHETHPEIAAKLHISVETARSHTASIRRKHGVQSNRELVGVSFTAPGNL